MQFPKEYPNSPPVCIFTPPLFHPNVYPDGKVCLSIINPQIDWKPSISVKQILLGIQDLLDNPNPKSPANGPAYELYVKSKTDYVKRIKEIASKNKPSELVE